MASAAQKFDIAGMTCSACSAHVEKTVAKLKGVSGVTVSLLSNSMTVTYNDERITPDMIVSAVEKSGYGASVGGNAEVQTNKSEDEISAMKLRLIISAAFTIPLMYVSMGYMLGLPSIRNMTANAFTQFLLTLPVVYVNFNFYKNGFRRLFTGAPNMDSLIAAGSGAALIYGIYAVYKQIYGVTVSLYFESAAMILTLVTLGKFFEARAKGKTSEAISRLMRLAPDEALVERNGKEIAVLSGEVVVGDIVIVKSGSTLPADGVIIEGNGEIDESALTGESLPISKSVGDNVAGATVNHSGYFKFRVIKTGKDTVLSQIIKLVEEAASSKAPVSRLADKVSGIFVPIVIILAVLTASIWLLLGRGVEFALTSAVSVLVISCPCALGLATPTAVMAGTGRGAEHGILIKSGEALERTQSVKTVVFDKTGTITEGRMNVAEINPSDGYNETELLTIASAVEKLSEHPIAQAIVNEAEKRGITIPEASKYKAVPGRGIAGEISGVSYIVGNNSYMRENGIEVTGNGLFAADVSNGRLCGSIITADRIRPTSHEAMQAFKKMNIKTVMLTGDNKETAENIAREAGIDTVIAEVMPEDKVRVISELQAEGNCVAMVGDGINDAPALVKADVGMAIAAGTDVAVESADIVIMKSDLNDTVAAVLLSKATLRIIKENLFWALFYNAICIPLAASGMLNPMIAAGAMSLSSVCVVANALRLRKVNITWKKH